MYSRVVVALMLSGVLTACAGPAAQSPIYYEAIDPSQFKSPADKQQKYTLAENQCRARALQAASGVQIPAGAQTQTTNVYNGSATPTTSGGLAGGLAQGLARGTQMAATRQSAYAQNQALQQRNAVGNATYIACMNEHGFMQSSR